MHKLLPMNTLSFSEETITSIVEQLKRTKSSMSRLGRTQLSRFVLSLTRDEVIELVELMIPFFVARSGKFVDNLTVDQQLAVHKTLFPQILAEAHNQGKVANLLLGLYSVSRIGESLEVLSTNQ